MSKGCVGIVEVTQMDDALVSAAGRLRRMAPTSPVVQYNGDGAGDFHLGHLPSYMHDCQSTLLLIPPLPSLASLPILPPTRSVDISSLLDSLGSRAHKIARDARSELLKYIPSLFHLLDLFTLANSTRNLPRKPNL